MKKLTYLMLGLCFTSRAIDPRMIIEVVLPTAALALAGGTYMSSKFESLPAKSAAFLTGAIAGIYSTIFIADEAGDIVYKIFVAAGAKDKCGRGSREIDAYNISMHVMKNVFLALGAGGAVYFASKVL